MRNEHRNSPWGIDAERRLQTRMSITDESLARLRKRVEQNAAYVDKLSQQYYEGLSSAENKKNGPDIKSSEDEVLENSYNSMYDFE